MVRTGHRHMENDLLRVRRTIAQTSVLIETDLKEAVEAALKAVYLHRLRLENYISRNPMFLLSLEPVEVLDEAPEVVKRMASAAHAANVGPMAAVAGALADLMVEAMASTRAEVMVVENGGEVSALSRRPVNVRVYAGSTASLSGRVGFRLQPWDMPVGVGTSSATLGRGLSFGEADSATVFAVNAAVADAAATSVCNAVMGSDVEESIQRGLRTARTIPGVHGALIARGGFVGSVGKVPELIEVGDALVKPVSGKTQIL